MRNTYRPEAEHISDTLTRVMPVIERVTSLYQLAQETVTECMSDCDDMGSVALSRENSEEFNIPCPLCCENCGYGERMIAKARVAALDSLREIIPKKVQKNILSPSYNSILMQAESWNYDGVLFINGDVGVGKTFCAAYVLLTQRFAHYRKSWRSGNYSSGRAVWLSAYRAAISANLDLACGAGILVIDDLGTESDSKQNHATISEIISKRYDNDAPTIITSNLPMSKVEKDYGRWISDRILNSGVMIKYSGESLRLAS